MTPSPSASQSGKPLRVAMICTDTWESKVFKLHPDRPNFGTAPAALLDGFAALGPAAVETHVISCVQTPVPRPARLAENLWYHQLVVPKIGWLRTGYQGCIRAIRRQVRAVAPDLVHGQGTERDCALAAVFSGRPNVITIHGNMRHIARVTTARPFSFLWLAARLETVALRRAGGVICISQYTAASVNALARRTWRIPNAVDMQFFQGQSASVSPPVVLCVGNISRVKNQNDFIRALAPLAASRNFRVVFLGALAEQDPYAAEFKALLQEHPWCEFGGFASREELRHHLGGSTLLALPSVEDNCPMCVLEAMAAGVPVAAARIGGVPELITDGDSGLLFNPRAPAEIQRAVQRLLDDPALRQRAGQRARQAAENRYHPAVIAQRHLEVYREALSGSAGVNAEPRR